MNECMNEWMNEWMNEYGKTSVLTHFEQQMYEFSNCLWLLDDDFLILNSDEQARKNIQKILLLLFTF